MGVTRRVVSSSVKGLTVFFLFFCLLYMEVLRIGTLNINGGRDRNKQAVLVELNRNKNIDVLFLQETHSSLDNETEWGMNWEGNYFLSHGTNFSAGVAILFSQHLHLTNVSVCEVEEGRFQIVQATIKGIAFVFINIYAYNTGAARIELFHKLNDKLKQFNSNSVIVLGGDWNCTTHHSVDRNAEEPHPPSASLLNSIVEEHDLTDVWRKLNSKVRQYTWVKITEDSVRAARLDRIYVNQTYNNRLSKAVILPVGFSDHHLVILDFSLQVSPQRSSYWHFNARLIYDKTFCQSFSVFWSHWRLRKKDFENLVKWWEVGKTQIKIFCQQYTAHTTATERQCVKELEKEIRILEEEMVNETNNTNSNWDNRKKVLASFLHEKAKGALIRAQISKIKDIDAPTRFFFKLERKVRVHNQMMHLKLPNGTVTSDPAEMRKLAIDFYSGLFSADSCNADCMDEILKGLPQLGRTQLASLESTFSFEELSAAAQQLCCGRSPGIDGLPSEFYKKFWTLLGEDLFEVFKGCLDSGTLPLSCTRAVLALLPKKGDLGLLKNWRPVSLLCTDYKIIAKCFSNRLKECIGRVVHTSQTYCIPERTIMDNLFLIRDIIDLSKLQELNVGLFSIDQEKAFDRVDHVYLFKTLEAFGFGEKFISWIKLLYSRATVLLKVGGGLSRPVPAQRGIRQGCPLSGMLYALAIEPLLSQLRQGLSGLTLAEKKENMISLSAYADDVTVFITGQTDIQILEQKLALYEQASSAKVNWSKCDGLILGEWKNKEQPTLPVGLKWSSEGLKFLGVFFGSNDFQKRNWEGLVEKISARLSRWKWVQPQLSYRGRTLVANNLVASMLWHRCTVIEPPDAVIKEIQKRLVNFFWGGFHWTRSAVLFLPVSEGGQGLIDLRSRIKAFRLQTAQRLLYQKQQPWIETASVLLHKVKNLAYDKHLFLLDLAGMDISQTSCFYQSVLHAWRTVLKASRNCSQFYRNVGEEPLLHNPLIQSRILSSASVQRTLITAGVTKLAGLRSAGQWKTAARLSGETGIKSLRLVEKLLEEVMAGLPGFFREALGTESAEDQSITLPEFPPLSICAAAEEQEEDNGALLTFRTPELMDFSQTSKKSLYAVSVKVLNQTSLVGVPESGWLGVLAPGSSPRGSWRSRYKPPIEKRCADLQWRVVHGAVATNRHVAHIDPRVGSLCVFCQAEENLQHLWLCCPRLVSLFFLLQQWLADLGHVLDDKFFIFGPIYSVAQCRSVCLVNFLLGQAKMSIWLTRRNKMKGTGSIHPEPMFRGLVAARLKIEFAYYKMVSDIDEFILIWGVGNVLCNVVNESLFLFF